MTRFAERKADAIRAYASQLAHMDIPAKVAALNHARTVNVADPGVRACEAYCRVTPEGFADYLAAAEAAIRVVDRMGPFAS
jgi:LmbE family N-acetylglucosaminyl deacetylase